MAAIATTAPIHHCNFSQNAWNRDDFIQARSSRWEHIGHWDQQEDHIVNRVPIGASSEQMLNQRAGETYAALLLKQPLQGDHTLQTTLSFDYRMAPSLTIAHPLQQTDDKLPVMGEHYEIVAYDQGINIWHHWFVDGKQTWRRAAFLNAHFAADTRYILSATLSFPTRGPKLTVTCGPHTFGYTDDHLPHTYQVGIIACEGINRFYDFSVY